MKLTPYSLEQLKEIILGEEKEPGYLKGGQLVELFNKVGVKDVYNYNNGEGLPHKWSRKIYVKERLKQLNGKEKLKQLLEILIPFKKENYFSLNTDKILKQINEIINDDEYELKSVNGIYEISSLKKSNISNKLEKREPKMYYSIYIETKKENGEYDDFLFTLDIASREELLSNYAEPYIRNEEFYIDGTSIRKEKITKFLIKETLVPLLQEVEFRKAQNRVNNILSAMSYEREVLNDKSLGKNIEGDVFREIKTKLKEENEIKMEEKEEKNKKVGNKVFIVHGHDNELKLEVELFIKNLGLTPVILHEQINNGNTIIEKFEKNTNEIGYAIILYTPCDKGFSSKDGEGRARQNVIFEHGFFIGKLGRKYVAAIKKDNVEVPSDLSGILYIEYDTKGAWKFELAKEMKGIGFDIDLNHIL